MTLLVANKPLAAQTTNITANILDINAGPHSLTFVGSKQVLTIENNEAVPITVNMLGDGVVSFNCPGLGPQNVSAGKDIVIAAGDTEEILVSSFGGFMGDPGNNVALTFTGSTGTDLAFAWLSEYN